MVPHERNSYMRLRQKAIKMGQQKSLSWPLTSIEICTSVPRGGSQRQKIQISDNDRKGIRWNPDIDE